MNPLFTPGPWRYTVRNGREYRHFYNADKNPNRWAKLVAEYFNTKSGEWCPVRSWNTREEIYNDYYA